MKPLYVVFTGPSLVGKSTAARLLASALQTMGSIVISMSFEMPTRRYLATLYGLSSPISEMDKPYSELLSLTPRQFIQREAAHMRFTYGPGVLGKLLVARVRRAGIVPEYVIVDDGTNPLDVAAFGDYLVVAVARDRVERIYPFAIPNPDMVVRNSGSINDLRTAMRRVVDRCGTRMK